MSLEFNLDVCNSLTALSRQYSVSQLHGCRIVYGSVPIEDLVALTKLYSKKALMEMSLSKHLGAQFVLGEPDQLEILRELRRNGALPPGEAVLHEIQQAREKHFTDLARWLEQGDRGLSSQAMAKQFFGIPLTAGIDHPRDSGDFFRCVEFLDSTKTKDRLDLMTSLSPQWAALVQTWDDLESKVRAIKNMNMKSAKTIEDPVMKFLDELKKASQEK